MSVGMVSQDTSHVRTLSELDERRDRLKLADAQAIYKACSAGRCTSTSPLVASP